MLSCAVPHNTSPDRSSFSVPSDSVTTRRARHTKRRTRRRHTGRRRGFATAQVHSPNRNTESTHLRLSDACSRSVCAGALLLEMAAGLVSPSILLTIMFFARVRTFYLPRNDVCAYASRNAHASGSKAFAGSAQARNRLVRESEWAEPEGFLCLSRNSSWGLSAVARETYLPPLFLPV